MEFDFLPIPADIKRRDVRYSINVKDKRAVISLKYNSVSDAFYISIFDAELKPYIRGRKIVYGENINYLNIDGLKGVKIVPISKYKEDEINGVKYNNIDQNVRLAVFYD